ncbi:Fic family protein [Thalassomonas sp. RHCl1]|uniref:Fic family protein n=1 Tax=Thalassomonas sp. RHCl1 TaxID=2995320 RepID=UPI00248AE2A3|nr:Fic family protein [Thalassomonas sp. RHCl1]
MSIETLIRLPRIILGDNKKGIRQRQNWIVPSQWKANRFLPPAQFVPEYLAYGLVFFNSSRQDPMQKVIIGACLFVYIHRFSDGNGHVFRILIGSAFEPAGSFVFNPIFFHLVSDSAHFLSGISAFAIKSCQGFNHPYWQGAFTRDQQLTIFTDKYLADICNKFMTKLASTSLFHKAKSLINFLWQRTLMCESGVIKPFDRHKSFAVSDIGRVSSISNFTSTQIMTSGKSDYF